VGTIFWFLKITYPVYPMTTVVPRTSVLTMAFTIEKPGGDSFSVLSAGPRFVATIGQLSGLEV
jgi:hypothetical protein